jgi:septum formation inhibitor-activating ATPase MinD
MCEAHANDAVRASVNAEKVTSSHKAGETVVICDDATDSSLIKDAIEKVGYKVTDIKEEPHEKKGFFARFKK